MRPLALAPLRGRAGDSGCCRKRRRRTWRSSPIVSCLSRRRAKLRDQPQDVGPPSTGSIRIGITRIDVPRNPFLRAPCSGVTFFFFVSSAPDYEMLPTWRCAKIQLFDYTFFALSACAAGVAIVAAAVSSIDSRCCLGRSRPSRLSGTPYSPRRLSGCERRRCPHGLA
jgi:hypothetical protein